MIDQKQHMTVDFPGLLALLGDRLYADKRVFVRELIQNGSDSILRRFGAGRASQGRIDVEVVPSERRITFRDNGLGMNQDDIAEFLAKIAASGTREAREGVDVDDLIGQHGIGFLSAFVVANRVRVRTRKLNDDKAWIFENEGQLDYTLLPLDPNQAPDVGTAVDVFIANEKAKELVSDSAVRDILLRYCDMLRTPIFLNGSRNPINTQIMPWERDGTEEKKEFDTRVYLEKTSHNSVLEVIPVDLKNGVRASGVLYISTTQTISVDIPREVRLYQSRMLLTNKASEILPPWAIFIDGVIDSPDITPNAARDDFIRNDKADELTEQLGARIIEFLADLHARKPARFKEIIDYHNLGLMRACAYHDDLFDRFYDLLLWHVNAKPFNAKPGRDVYGESEPGTWLTLSEILDRLGGPSSPEVEVPIISDRLAVPQYFEMADAANDIIVDTSGWFADDLMRKIEGLASPLKLGGRRIRTVQVAAEGADRLFKPATRPEDEPVRRLAAEFDMKVDVEGARLRVEAARTVPESVVGVVRTGSDIAADLANAQRTAGDTRLPDSVRSMARELLRLKRRENIRLVLNAENPLVRKLADALARGDTHDSKAASVVRGSAAALYNIAVLNSRAALTPAGQALLGRQFTATIERLIDAVGDVGELQVTVETLKASVARYSPRPFASRSGDVVTVFYMTPFKDEFEDVRAVVRRVVTNMGARLLMATDEARKELLIENLHDHIQTADAFIADITGLNPNVMLELGAVKFDNVRRRPVALLASGMETKDIPADLQGQLRIDYGGRRGAELESYLSRELRTKLDFWQVLDNPARARHVSVEMLAKAIETTSLNPSKLDLDGLARAFPTNRRWQEATEDEVAGRLPQMSRKHAAEILEVVRGSLQG